MTDRPSSEREALAPGAEPADLDETLDGAPHPWTGSTGTAEVEGPPGHLKRQAAVSILWTIVRTGSDYFLSFAVFALLARKLGPAAFGVFALAAACAEFGRILPSSGLVNALSRAKHVSAEMADTVFWSTLALALAIAAVAALVARPLAAAFGEPAVAPLLAALGLILPISAAGATHIALKLRDFGHRSMASRSVVSGVLGGAAGLSAAWAGWGPWSLVVQRAVSEVAGTAMAWQAYRWLPGRRYSSAVLRELAGHGMSMTITQLLFVGLVRIQDIIIGRVIGAAAVGVYRTAWRTVELIAQGVIMPFSLVSLPTLARLQDDLPAFRKAYLRMVSVSAALAFPAIIGFAVLAPHAITLIFGARWAESAKIAQVLGLMAVPFTLNYFAGPALAALGRSGTLAKIAALNLTLTVVLSLIAVPVRPDRGGGRVRPPGLSHPAGADGSVQAPQRRGLPRRPARHCPGAVHGPGDGGLSPPARPSRRGANPQPWCLPARHDLHRGGGLRGVAAALRPQLRRRADQGPAPPAPGCLGQAVRRRRVIRKTNGVSVRADGIERSSVIRRLQEQAAAKLRDVPADGPFCLLDFPDQRNVGDSAIWLGATAYFREHRGPSPATSASIAAFSEAALRASVPEGPIFIHGGGNFGDLWPRHHEFRERLLERFPDREIIQLPQSIHFEDPGRVARTAHAIARHGRFRLLVRDQPSYEFATANFDCEVRLCPDMAFFLGALDRQGTPEVDVFYLMRTDKERALGAPTGRPEYTSRVADWLTESRLSVQAHKLLGIARGLRGGWPGRAALRRVRYDAAARARVVRGCRLLSSGRVVITDRLHAHILSLLLGIPHAVLDNSYGKLGRFLDAWTGEAAGVHRASSTDEAERWAASVVSGAR